MPTAEQWDEYFEGVRRYLASGRLDSDEINYKVEIQRKLEDARRAFLDDEDGWIDLLKRALSGKGHPAAWRGADDLITWLKGNREAGRELLGTVWSDGDLKRGDIRAFSEQFPSDAGPAGAGSRLRTIRYCSWLSARTATRRNMVTAYRKSFERLGYDSPPADADEETTYRHALAFSMNSY